MSSNVDRPIGSTFEFEGEMLEVVKRDKGVCEGCSLNRSDSCWDFLSCTNSTRKDGTGVMAIPAKTVTIEEF